MTKKRIQVEGAKVLVMGLTFKENCPDLRNTRVVDIVAELKDYNCEVDVFDPWTTAEVAQHEYDITPIEAPQSGVYDAIILAVAHHQFKDMGATAIRTLGKPAAVLYDLKYVLSKQESDLRL
jgi:UDP-N-acetyl-D-galactosamine dehydrogenase